MIGKKINQLATELAPESTDLTIIGDPTTGVSKKITLAQLGAIFSGAVSFYNDLASFPVSGDINVIYCAKDTQKLYLWSGSAYVEVFPSQALLDTYQLRSEKGNANGYASLDSQGKVPISQLPSSIMEYKGTWNAATNTPTLANGTGDTGDVYICNVAGTVNFGAGPITFAVGDYVIYSGTIWQRSSGAVGTVTSVAASITGDSVTISGSPVTTSGTLAFAFAGTGAQYIKGDGTLATFPTTIDQAKNLITEIYNNTGATLTKGTIVYITGGQGNLPTVSKALATTDATSAQTYGVVQTDITNMNNGFVVVAGRLTDIDTQAYSNGTQLYLSPTTAGTWTSTKPTAPNHMVYVGIIVRSHPTQGVVEIKIQNGLELIELADVSALTPSNNDGLFYESSTSLWKNKSIATVLGYTPANAATYVPYTGATANVDLGAFDLLSRSAYLEGTASYQAGLLIKQRGLYNFVTGAYTQIVADSATDLNIVHNQANTTRRRYALSVAALQDGDSFQYLLPRANGTIALTSDLTGGTVTSVAALTIGTSGTDLSSTVANGTTTPVITLNVPTASATNRGALSSTDWTTFNNKQNALTNPVTGTGTTNYLPKFTGTSAIGNSQIRDDGSGVSIGIAPQTDKLFIYNASGTNTGLTIQQDGTGDIVRFNGNSGANKFIVQQGGNVGIGTTSPNTLLSLVGNHAGGQSILKIQSSTAYSSSGLSSIGFNDSDGSRKAIIYTNTNGLQLETGTTTPIIFNTNGNERMRVDASGNVGIGTSSPITKLTINNGGANTSTNYEFKNISVTGGFLAGYTGTAIQSLLAGYDGNSIYGTDIGYGYDGTGYALMFSTNDNTSGNPIERLRIASTGAATFSSSVTAGGSVSITDGQYFIYDTRTNAANRNWVLVSNSNVYGDFSIRQSNAKDGNPLTSGTDRLTISPSGSVGIGTTSPTDLLDITRSSASNSTGGLTLTNTDNSGYGSAISWNLKLNSVAGVWGRIYTEAASSTATYMSFQTTIGGSLGERMRINSAGNVGIGTSSPSSKLHVKGVLSIERSDAAQISTISNEGGNFFISSASGFNTIFQDGSTERMRISTSGNVGIGTTSPGRALEILSTSEQLRLSYNASTYTEMRSDSAGGLLINAGGNYIINYIAGSAKTRINSNGDFIVYSLGTGTVYSNGGILTNTNPSDKRLKNNIQSISYGLNEILKLNPVTFDWKEDKINQGKQYGFIAQEVQKVMPDLVKNLGIQDYLGLDKEAIFTILVKAIQELNDKIK